MFSPCIPHSHIPAGIYPQTCSKGDPVQMTSLICSKPSSYRFPAHLAKNWKLLQWPPGPYTSPSLSSSNYYLSGFSSPPTHFSHAPCWLEHTEQLYMCFSLCPGCLSPNSLTVSFLPPSGFCAKVSSQLSLPGRAGYIISGTQCERKMQGHFVQKLLIKAWRNPATVTLFNSNVAKLI